MFFQSKKQTYEKSSYPLDCLGCYGAAVRKKKNKKAAPPTALKPPKQPLIAATA
ncbi:hypothetical protein FHS56_000205 [Thermonema lapsum]|uniref:Uncharacterized protein n=1 Tax=Thermonema lapsum TaxID=28195 RepID=A0A846MMM3_9BACT|nr:hypothetical protein [Thermonema lapsum]NIK72719.1 hypothetical protein [Thermonema lapsum]